MIGVQFYTEIGVYSIAIATRSFLYQVKLIQWKPQDLFLW
jgi:hypothetical protein